MDMQIVIPSGEIRLDGYPVQRMHRKPYIIQNGDQRFLTDAEKRLAKEMRKVFAPMLDKEGEY